MYSKKSGRIRSAIVSAAMALTAFAAPLSSTTAPSLTADAATDNYAQLLQYSLYFYDANMCGDNSTGALSWRKDCHTSDEVKGGFHDAGDHAMFGLPQGFTASTLGWSYFEFKDAYNATGQGQHLKVITDHFCEFFKGATKLNGNTVTGILYQKGNGDDDHDYWGAPENQTGSRRMYWSNNGASDIAAEYAAALAFNYINFGNAEDLKYAEALYKFSTQYNQVATEGLQSRDGNWFYKNSSCQDEQAWAAAVLYHATKNQSYLNDAKSKVTQYLGWVHGWENVDLGAACLIAEATNDWTKVNNWISTTTQQKTQNGYYFLDKWGSARLNCSMQFTALVASKHSSADYTNWAKGQMDYITGTNPSGYSFVIGIGNKYPQNPHHRAASGYSSYAEMGDSHTAKSNSPTLIGALVGGPGEASGAYSDDIKDYVCNEVALDYNAGLVGAAAGLYELVNKNGSTSSNIPGVTKIYSGSVTPGPTQTTTTTSNNPYQPTTTTTTTQKPVTGNGKYTYSPNQKVVFDDKADDKMIGWDWAEFGIPANEKVTKVEVKLSASGNLGTWTGAFGSSTTVAADSYWTMSDEMKQTFNGNSGTVTWNVPAATANIIQYNYGGQLKFGTWWIDNKNFTVDSITVYTNGSSSGQTTTSTTKYVQPTTTTTTTQKPVSGNGKYTYSPNQKVVFDDSADDKMIGWKWSEFDIPSNEKVTKVEVKLSANGNLGTWTGAFGSSTTVAADDYWTMSEEMKQAFNGNSGTITWNVPAATANIIQYNYGGELKFGTWWIDNKNFTVESITVYTNGSSSGQTTTTTSTTKTTTTTTTTSTTTPPTKPTVTMYGDANCDGKVDISDAVLIMQYLANPYKYTLTAAGFANSDVVDGNGITATDALALQMVEAKTLSTGDLPTTSTRINSLIK